MSTPGRLFSNSVAAALGIAAAAGAQELPLGPEFQINSYTIGGQAQPFAVPAGGGDFVAVWQSAGQDGSGYGIIGRPVSHLPGPSGPEFAVNTQTAGSQTDPEIAAPSGRLYGGAR
jgi:hypothetical protein